MANLITKPNDPNIVDTGNLVSGTPLNTPPTPFILNNPITGSGQNLLNQLQFFFPVAAAQAGLTIGTKAAFRANDARSQFGYSPNDPEYYDPTKSFGLTIGRPQYGILELGNTDPHVQNGNQYTGIDGKTYTFQNLAFAIAIIDAKQTKNIVKTKITGRDGEIKEYIGMNDWGITISSVIDMPADEAPLEFLQAFMQIIKAQVSIPVKNYYLNTLGITNIVIEDIDLGQSEGGYSSQPVKITACSDIPIPQFLP